MRTGTLGTYSPIPTPASRAMDSSVTSGPWREKAGHSQQPVPIALGVGTKWPGAGFSHLVPPLVAVWSGVENGGNSV
jgi:hypothetical protein